MAGSVMGQVKLLGRVSIKSKGSGSINRKLDMGWAGPSLVFFIMESLGSIWWWGLTMLLHGLFSFYEWAQPSCGTSLFWD